MGGQREDPDPSRGPNRAGGTEPGLGGSAAPAQQAQATSNGVETEPPPPVDFDALHAALGDPLDLDELPEPAEEPDDLQEDDDPAPTPAPRGKPVRVGESSGRSSATYASARPHTIPPTRAPQEDLNAPAVIVATEDTVPTAPPQMTVPLAQPPPQPLAVPVGISPGAAPVALGNAAGSGPHPAAAPASGPHASAYPVTPPAFRAQRPIQAPHQMTMRMPDRPILDRPLPDRPINPRRPRTETIVVRPRAGPSAKQKLVAFGAMLVLFTAAGIAVIILQKPSWLGLDSPAAPSASTSAAPSTAITAPPPPAGSAAPSPDTSSSASSTSASSTPPASTPKPKPRPAPRP